MKKPRESPSDPPPVPEAEPQRSVDHEDQSDEEIARSISDLVLATDLGSQRS